MGELDFLAWGELETPCLVLCLGWIEFLHRSMLCCSVALFLTNDFRFVSRFPVT